MPQKIKFTQNQINEIILDYKRKISAFEIAKKYNVSGHTILRLLKQKNTPIRNVSFDPYKKYSVDESFFQRVNSLNSFIVGVMASDGNIVNDRQISLSQSGDNGKKLIEFIKEKLQYNGVIYVSKTSKKDSHCIAISSRKLVCDLKKHNILVRKSYTYEYNGKAQFNQFLQGYVEGDGSIGVYNSGTCLNLVISFFGNENFKNSIINLLPLKPHLRRVNGCFFEIKYTGKAAVEFCDWLWEKPVYNESLKYKKYLDYVKKLLPLTKFTKYGELNKKIMVMLSNGKRGVDVAKELGIKKHTVYNLKSKRKNGINTY